MNFLKTTETGGFPFVLDDLRYMDAATRDAINKIVIGLNGGALNGVVEGMTITSDGVGGEIISAGYILVNGEVIRVDEHVVDSIDLVDYQKVVIEETADPEGEKTFENGGIFDTYIKRRAKLVAGSNPVPPGTIVFRNTVGQLFPTLRQSILGELSSFLTSWSTIAGAAITGWSSHASWGGAGSLRFKKTGKVGFINFRGTVDFTGSHNNFEFNAPAGFVLDSTQNRQIALGTHLVDGAATVIRVNLTTAGKIQVVRLSGNFTTGDIEFNTGAIPLQ